MRSTPQLQRANHTPPPPPTARNALPTARLLPYVEPPSRPPHSFLALLFYLPHPSLQVLTQPEPPLHAPGGARRRAGCCGCGRRRQLREAAHRVA